MWHAVKEAEAARRAGGSPIGCVIVRAGVVIAHGRSLAVAMCDPSAHAEINAIRSACAHDRRHHLPDVVLYSTLEPCGMCIGCASWARIPLVVYGARAGESRFYETQPYRVEERAALSHLAPLEVIGGILERECLRLIERP